MSPFLLILLSLFVMLYTAFAFLWPRTKYKALQCTGFYFLAVWLINLAAQVSAAGQRLWLDLLFDSVIGSLQSFSLDASYGEILSGLDGGVLFPGFVHIYASLALMIAPVVGGAAILTVLANVFPILKFWIRSRLSSSIYLFSFLNEQSLHIVQELVDRHEAKKPYCIVFANTWVEEGNEDESNLVGRAKELGSICLKEDLSMLRIPKGKEVTYFLAREEDMRNLDDAIYLAGTHGSRQWSDCRHASVYVYAQSDMTPEILERIYSKVDSTSRERLKLSIIPYKTMTVYQLLAIDPLYRYLGQAPEEEEDLSVVIVGDDEWAVELFKAVFWCGQLPHKRLRIRSVCADGDWFKSRLHYLVPELDVVDNGIPFCETEFMSSTPGTDAFYRLISDPALSDSSIWFVCLGDDQLNMETAALIQQRMNAIHLCAPKKAVVHYQISSNDLMQTLNSVQAGGKNTCSTHAFASLAEQYSVDNLWGELYELAWMVDDVWASKNNEQTAENEYRRRASLASALHIQYKLYAFGQLTQATSDSWTAIEQGLDAYLKDKDFQAKHAYEIGYLEHRRWSAYIRSQGYSLVKMEDWEAFYQTEEGAARKNRNGRVESKYPECKLHTCLVGYSPVPTADFELLPASTDTDWSSSPEILAAEAEGRLDELDLVSVRLHRLSAGLKKSSGDMKYYDTQSLFCIAEKYIVYRSLKHILERTRTGESIHGFTKLSGGPCGRPVCRQILYELRARLLELPLSPEVIERVNEKIDKATERISCSKECSVKCIVDELTKEAGG